MDSDNTHSANTTHWVKMIFAIFFGLVPTVSAVVQSVPVNITHVAKFGHQNAGFLNSTGQPIHLEFTTGSTTMLNAYSSTYNLEDLITLSDLIHQKDDPAIPDGEYFHFSQSNLEDSQHGLFYARWSISAQRNPEFKTLGEDGLFVKEFTGDYNFKCPLEAATCLGMVSRYEIQDMFPQNRPLARLVYFQIMKIALLHDVANGAHNSMKDTHVYVMGHIHDIVSSFTRQPDSTRALICSLTQEVVSTLSNMAISTALSYVPQLQPLQIIIGNSKLLKESFARLKPGNNEATWKYPFKTGKFKDWWGKLSDAEKLAHGFNEKTKPLALTLNMDPAGKLYPYMFRFFTQYDHTLSTSASLDQGYSKSVLCGGFEGDESNRLEGNKNKLLKHLSGYFLELERNIRDQYRMITSGHILEADGHLPTLQGVLGMHMLWTGSNSITETLANMEPMRAAIATALEKQIISDVIRKDGNWAACTHHTNAQKLCLEAQRARDSNSNKHTDAIKGRFCPDVNDQTLICATGRWYHHKFSSHVVPFAPLKTFQNYASTYYTMSFEEAMSEAYMNYKEKKNDMALDTQGWTLGHVRGGGMRVAFCVGDHYKLTDFGGYVLAHARPSVSWEMPAVCGEQGIETAEFLNAVGLGIGSQAYTAKEDFGKPTQLFRDRFPRKLNTLSPYLSYMQYGRIGIQFPQRRSTLNLTTTSAASNAKSLLLSTNPAATPAELSAVAKAASKAITSDPRWTLMNRWKVFTGIDVDFENVRAATEGNGRSETVNNIWFCGEEGRKVHGVFERERGHVDLSSFPTGRIDSHKKKCERWLREHSVEVAGLQKRRRFVDVVRAWVL